MKKSIVVIFGGRSGEHEVSVLSASSVVGALDRRKYDVIPVHVMHDGRWFIDRSVMMPEPGREPSGSDERYLVPVPGVNRLLKADGGLAERVDIVFPLVHGTGGEDGTLQGLLELAEIPYVGCGVLGSAVGMDKVTQKRLLRNAGLPVVPWVHFRGHEWERDPESVMDSVEGELGYPNFVKPANLGSAVGISKAHHRRELQEAMLTALTYDTKVLVEYAVPRAREIECSVIGNREPQVSVFGEIIPSNEFYDYAAKYTDGRSEAIIPAPIPRSLGKKLREFAERAYLTLDTEGMARVDFLIARDSNDVYINETNTLPGFTSISMFPKLWAESGVAYPKLLDKVLGLAEERMAEKRALKREYGPGSAR